LAVAGKDCSSIHVYKKAARNYRIGRKTNLSINWQCQRNYGTCVKKSTTEDRIRITLGIGEDLVFGPIGPIACN
jgi:hypothetical protein